MLELVMWWLVVGFLAGIVVLFLDHKTSGYLTIGDIVKALLLLTLLGFVGAAIVLYGTVTEWVSLDWLDKKVFVKEEK